MARFKSEPFHYRNAAGAEVQLALPIQISAAGAFYAHLPDRFVQAFAGLSVMDAASAPKSRGLADHFKVQAATFEGLKAGIYEGLKRHMQPEVFETAVIRYNLESHVAFAQDDDGNIFPNAAYPGAKWASHDGRFGEHHATAPARGGYSLVVGARAMLKRVTRFGEKEHVTYESYYKDGCHLGRDNPAQLLNSWAALSLPENAKEIPYTDEAALFFHKMLLGMAHLNRTLQEATFDQAALLGLIARQDNNLLLGGPSATR